MLNIEQDEIEGGSCRGLKYQIIEVIFFTLLNEMKYKIMHYMIKDFIIQPDFSIIHHADGGMLKKKGK